MKDNKIITKFSDFDKINEADLYDNQGIPVEYLRKVKQENETRARRNPPGDIMRLVRQVQSMQSGNEEQLEKIAIDTIKDLYGDILDNVEIDAKLVRHGEVINSLRDASTDEDESSQDDTTGSNEQTDEENDFDETFGSEENIMEFPSRALDVIDPDTLNSEIDKRKISNAISQGESKNIHRIIHLPEVKDKLDAINPRFVSVMDELLKSAEIIEWLIPMSAATDMMENNPNGLSKVEWVNKSDDEKSEKTAQDVLDEIKELDDINDFDEELEDIFDDGEPKIIARAIDFTILLHEITKGIFELIIARAIPSDAKLAKKISDNTDTFQDEFEDLRYGVDMRRDLTAYLVDIIDTVAKTKRTKYTHKHLKEFVFGNMLDVDHVSTKDFLLIMNVIFSDAAGLDIESSKKSRVDAIIKTVISKVIDELDTKWDKYHEDLEKIEKWETAQAKEIKKETDPTEITSIKKDLSEVDRLNKDLDLAFDEERYDDAEEIQSIIDSIID